MESLDSIRRSEISTLVHQENIPDRPYSTSSTPTTATAMAAAAVVSPTSSIYLNGPPPPYSSESRRTSDHKLDPPLAVQPHSPHHRQTLQTLPSIHEALSNASKPNPYASPVSASGPQPPHNLSYTTPQAPRPYAPREHAQYPSVAQLSNPRISSPPPPLHAPPGSFSRLEPAQASFQDHRPPAAAPPRNGYSGPRYEPPRFDHDPRPADRASTGYHQHSPSHSGYPYGPSPAALSSGPQGPAFSQPRYQQRSSETDVWKKEEERMGTAPFRQGLKRHLDVWDFENNLAQINVSSSALQEWSQHYNAIAQEQQRSVNVIPDRMPTLDSCNEMIEHQEKILAALLRMKDTIHQQDYAAIMDQRLRDQGKPPSGPGGSEYEDDCSMYGDEAKAGGGFGTSEGKKRRGRAAPPGRCHSCHRAETPEWRRGPDGARTLCNACGLHYAKLTRKNTMKQAQNQNGGSSLRPKSMDGIDARPL